jgi:hypothetical protein
MLSLSLGSIAGVGPLLRNELTLAGTFSSTDDHDRADDNLAVDDPRLVLGGVHAEDGSLRSDGCLRAPS